MYTRSDGGGVMDVQINESYREHRNLDRLIRDAQVFFAARSVGFRGVSTYDYAPDILQFHFAVGEGGHDMASIRAATEEFMTQHDNAAE